MKSLKEEIERSRRFLERLWHLENDERSGFLIGYTGPQMKGGSPVKSALFSTEGTDTVRDRLLDPSKFLRAQVEEIDGQLRFLGDFVPTLCPALGVVGIPSAFGCEVIWWEKDFPSVRPRLGNDPRQVYELKKPVVTDGELGRVLEYITFFAEKSNREYPIRMGDIQGPIDSAALICGHTNFLTALISNPDEMHHLLRLITELTIDFVKRQRALVHGAGVEFVPSLFQPWIPDGFGVSVSNDECVMISADLHDEFSVPYLNMLSEEFGGIYMHSCGDWTHQFTSLAKIRNLRGLEFGASEAPYEFVLEGFGGKVVLACRVGLHKEVKFNGMADFITRIRHASKTNRGLFIHVDITNGIVDETWPATDLNEIYRLLEA